MHAKHQRVLDGPASGIAEIATVQAGVENILDIGLDSPAINDGKGVASFQPRLIIAHWCRAAERQSVLVQPLEAAGDAGEGGANAKLIIGPRCDQPLEIQAANFP